MTFQQIKNKKVKVIYMELVKLDGSIKITNSCM